MIQFLKESTFVAQDVIGRSVMLLRYRYFFIAGLCFLLFLTSNTSGILAFYLNEVSPFLSAFMAFVFMVLYFGIYLSAFKYILVLLDRGRYHGLMDRIPSTQHMLRFFGATILVVLLMLAVFLGISVLAWPMIYINSSVEETVIFSVVVSTICSFYLLLRILFYPIFIIDKEASPLQAIRLSIALTKGNITKLLFIVLFFAILHLLYIYFNYLGYPLISTVLSFVNSFFVTPLLVVVVVVAYRSIMKNYQQEIHEA